MVTPRTDDRNETPRGQSTENRNACKGIGKGKQVSARRAVTIMADEYCDDLYCFRGSLVFYTRRLFQTTHWRDGRVLGWATRRPALTRSRRTRT